ncbi:hypothetical protein ACO0LO_07810 [Undibacterium sp. TJN25]|uniref:hypothetical protein n=1 Tax=Undibacterium sp. TJN25 TaxID=3413056 RepID=UPI003BEF725A
MGYPDWAVFQRTESGKAEIQNKDRGLTQSERLVLIIADGVSSYSDLRGKLKSLARERFDRAIRKLTDKGLLYEVMFPEEGQKPDVVDPDMMDRFLRQEDDDPVSIISFDPEEEHGDASLDHDSSARISLQNSRTSASPDAHPMPMPPKRADKMPDEVLAKEVKQEPAGVDFYLPVADADATPERTEPVLEPKPLAPPRPDSGSPVSIDTAKVKKAVSVFPTPEKRQTAKPAQKEDSGLFAKLRLNSSYILLFAGVSLICAPLLARFMEWLLSNTD